MTTTPWTRGMSPNGLWISLEDQVRIDRTNARLPKDDGRRLHYRTLGGRPLFPGQWSGNPWSAPILMLLLNPAFSEDLDAAYTDPELTHRVTNHVTGQWDDDYPNPWLHPKLRAADPWCATVAFAALHRHLTSKGEEPEAAWRRISRKCAILELGAWASYKWSSDAFCSTSKLSIQLAGDAMSDPGRIVLLGRGESDWKSAGLLDVDTLPKSRGVRVNQSRLSQANYPGAWSRILQLLEK